MQLMNIEFAPLNVPLERRLQTLATALWISLIFVGFWASNYFIFGVFWFGHQWMKLLMIGYLAFCYLDRETCRQGGRSLGRRWLRNLIIWRYVAAYFPVKLVKTSEIDSSKNLIFCTFPHGVVSAGVQIAFGTNALNCDKLFPGIDFRLVSLDQSFWCPFLREYVYTMGVVSCDSKSLNYLLSTKPDENDGPSDVPVVSRGLVLVPGGVAEAMTSQPGNYELVLKHRKGFVKIALKHGASLVPVFSFGETEIYDQIIKPKGSLWRNIQEFMKKHTRIAPMFPIGRGIFQYTFGMLPRRKQVTVVVGAAIDLPKIENPSQSDVDEYHEKFVNKLQELFETHKSEYLENHENISLVLV